MSDSRLNRLPSSYPPNVALPQWRRLADAEGPAWAINWLFKTVTFAEAWHTPAFARLGTDSERGDFTALVEAGQLEDVAFELRMACLAAGVEMNDRWLVDGSLSYVRPGQDVPQQCREVLREMSHEMLAALMRLRARPAGIAGRTGQQLPDGPVPPCSFSWNGEQKPAPADDRAWYVVIPPMWEVFRTRGRLQLGHLAESIASDTGKDPLGDRTIGNYVTKAGTWLEQMFRDMPAVLKQSKGFALWVDRHR